MVVLSNPTLEEMFLVKVMKTSGPFSNVPVIDLTSATAAADVVSACVEFGFFKVVNHGVPNALVSRLETEAMKFFSLADCEKEKAAGVANPFGYGNKRIGSNGDVGWLEYLLLEVTSKPKSFNFLSEPWATSFCPCLREYVSATRKLAVQLLELMAEGLGMKQRNALSKFVMDARSDSMLRLNHYPPFPMRQDFNQSINGFGEHTDPQIISVLRSNNCDGLQIALKDGNWVLVPPDQSSFFVNVGDSLQVLTNGRFRSVRHRVETNGARSRFSMIYFGGPPLSERLAPLPQLLREGEQSRYRDFTWAEYKSSAFKSKLGENRLGHFEKQQ
ncbi:hypothetical protein HPP92_023129 [Vanilla planifolia]|uniref:gibberellin 2beta-dioxygenase n=1 Tax=Vanilla planifolia TaxID=51239 RepID=A0A835UHW5_VANPL|nr:hypothetical protein HPP92_023129 [Vanilla planifolia]